MRWFDRKYGVPKQEQDFGKVHLICGVKTNVVTAVEIGDRHAADAPMFKPLVAETTKNFCVEEVSADSAYLSYKNAYVATSRGAWPFFAFKSNTTAKKGGALERMFHWYNLKREDYLAHYTSGRTSNPRCQ